MSAPRVAGVELGGTKIIAAVAEGRDILTRKQWPTSTDAGATLSAVATWLRSMKDEHGFQALGIASFGPICLDGDSPAYGHILRTPKAGWSNTDIVGALCQGMDVPVTLDTDVGGAALAEGLWGASIGCAVHAYLTIGTGIGAGIVVDGRPLHGALHPEIGHVRVRRAAGDRFKGICPFHGDCLEGLVSGPAIAARAGCPAENLDQRHPIWDTVANEIAQAIAMLCLTLSPQRIVFGGGVGSGQPHLLPRIRAATLASLDGYLPNMSSKSIDTLLVASRHANEAGVMGSIALALQALTPRIL